MCGIKRISGNTAERYHGANTTQAVCDLLKGGRKSSPAPLGARSNLPFCTLDL